MFDLTEKAKAFCVAAHQAVGQKRKYTNEPYWHHPFRVASLVMMVTIDPEVVAAAYLHDTVEDTGVDLSDIHFLFPTRVAVLVDALTDKAKPEHGNRAKRKELERNRLGLIPPEAMTIKIADLIDNTESITRHDADFAKVYLAEKRELLEVLKGGDRYLWMRAQLQLKDAACLA